MFNRFNTSKCKTQAKLCIGRVRLMRNKRQLAMKQMRREVADLLRANKQENARIRVEAVMREQNMLQAYEVLEIFLELLTVRLQMIEKSVDIPNDMFECLASLVYAASRVQDFPELVSIRGMLGHKYGKEFIEKASSDGSCRQFMVNENLIRCLAIGAPDAEVKLGLLSDIAQEHSVEWDSHRAHQEMITGGAVTRGYGGDGSFPGAPGGPPGGGGGGGGGNMAYGGPASPMFAPPPIDTSSPPAVTSPFGQSPSPQPQSKLKSMLKRVPTLGRSSPSHPPSDSFGPPPGGGGSGGGGGGGGEGEWGDAHAAASAAREYSQKAQNAADAAHRYASSNASSDLGVPDAKAPAPVVPRPARPQAKQPGNPDYPDIQVSGPPPPNFTPMSTNLPPAKPPTGPVDGGQGQGQPSLPPQLPPGQFRQRTDEEIQRDYDAAVGPPVKGGGPPSAPPAPDRESSPPARDNSMTLPSPPGVSKANGQSHQADAGIDEDLAARFEALKRG